jgi:AcrR family transcriptional regulator
MGINERREREKTERRKAILDCARELILLHGVEKVTMEDIAQKAELSKATLYLYFSNKEILLNEICEETTREFYDYINAFSNSGLKGLAALKHLWQGYVEKLGSSDKMIIIFRIYNYLNSWIRIITLEKQDKSYYLDTILTVIRTLIDQCKDEGVFNPGLDSALATRLVLSVFSIIIENAADLPSEVRGSPAVIDEMTSTFQIILHGFAKEGMSHSLLDLRQFTPVQTS